MNHSLANTPQPPELVARGASSGESPAGDQPPGPPVFEKSRQAPAVASNKPRTFIGMLGEWALSGGSSSWLASVVLHAAILLALSLWLFSNPPKASFDLTGEVSAPLDESPEFMLDSIASTSGEESREVQGTPAPVIGATAEVNTALVAPPALVGLESASVVEGLPSFRVEMSSPLQTKGGGFTARRPGKRRAAALAGGGTAASEDAVEAGLAWLAAHQWENGAWRFDLEKCPRCNGYCRNSGYYRSSTAATGLAILCFLGAGYTHQEGPYQETVQRGLYYLSETMAVTSQGGDLRDRFMNAQGGRDPGLATAVDLVRGRGDNLYSHAIATLALTEGYGMTHDADLKTPAQLAVDFTVNAQLDDGGWRYAPGWETPSAGDTTVSGWQIMGLKSATLAGLKVPYEVWLRFDTFLNSMEVPNTSEYRYRRGEKTTMSNTAIGTLCRMVMGRPLKDPHLAKGIAKVGDERPNKQHMYFNYYASQVLHHAGGTQWKRWNPRMREYLVETQATQGHERGSWYFAEPHSRQGGRLYTTAMAIMTLEVYYRYMPLYQEAMLEAR